MPQRQSQFPKAVTPASLIIGIALIVIGVVLTILSGELATPVIALGVVLTIVGWVALGRRQRAATDFEIAMILHAADDDDEAREDA